MTIQYNTKGVCSKQMKVTVDEGVVKSVDIIGGCHGNLQGISRLVEGMKGADAIEKMKGIRCGYKETSCPDQLAKAISIALAEEEKAKAQ